MTDAERWGAFVTQLADTLGVPEEWGGGFAEERILSAIQALQLGSLPRLMQLQAELAESTHTIMMSRLTFESILAMPNHAGTLALEALKRIERRAA